MTDNQELNAAIERVRKSDVFGVVERDLAKWRSWYPSEESGVDVPRKTFLALIDLAREFIARLDADEKRRAEEDVPVTLNALVTVLGLSPQTTSSKRLAYCLGTEHGLEWCPECGDLAPVLCLDGRVLIRNPTIRQLRKLIEVLEGK